MWDECPVMFGAPGASPVAALSWAGQSLKCLVWPCPLLCSGCRLSEDGNSAPIQLMRPGMINVQWIKLSEPWRPTLCASLEACGRGETSRDGKSSWRNPGSLQRGVDIEAVSKLGRISFAFPGVTESALGSRPGETLSTSCLFASQ